MKNSNDNIELKGTAIIERRTKDGKVIDRDIVKNLIVNTGKEHVAKLIGGLVSGISEFTTVAIGEGTTSATVNDTALENEAKRALATKSYEASYKAVFEKTFNFGSGESYSITEAGIFDSAVESGSTMLDRFVFSAKAVDDSTPLYVKITIEVSS